MTERPGVCEGGPCGLRGQWRAASGRGAGKTAAARPTRGPGGGWGVNLLEGDLKGAGPSEGRCSAAVAGAGKGRVGGRRRAARRSWRNSLGTLAG